ncbi:serine protease [Chloroflexi bacterium TSY]|nr:serine protease [Chloroflexi bacterium TSY]
MSNRLILIILINIGLGVTLYSKGYSQSQADSPHIFRIMASECKHAPEERRQTGFRVNDDKVIGIVTALHGVADCTILRALGTQFDIPNLEIVKVDTEHDLAMLWSNQITGTSGLEMEVNPEIDVGAGLYVIGYPYNLAVQLPTADMSYRGKTTLINLVPDDLIAPLEIRGSPALAIEVLSIEGHLLPGHSGAPILNENNRLVGIGNGGLDAGRVEIGWAVPWQQIRWESVSTKISDNISTDALAALEDLKEKNVLLFSFHDPDSSIAQIAEKTVCKSLVATNYQSLEALKADLLTTATYQAVGELFGELVVVQTVRENSQVSREQIQSTSAGLIRIAGNPRYRNHESNLAEVCISIEAYITNQDKKKLEPITLEDQICVSDPELSLGEIQIVAERRATLRVLLNYDQTLENISEEKILSLLRGRTFSGGFDDKTGAYCTTIQGPILPLEKDALLQTNSERAPELSASSSEDSAHELKHSTDSTGVDALINGMWQGHYTHSGSSKDMILHVENVNQQSFFGKIHLPTTSNVIMTIEGKELSRIDDIVEQSKWKYIEEYDEDVEQTLWYFKYTGKLQGGSVIETVVFRAVIDDSGTVMKGAWFRNSASSEPEGYITLLREQLTADTLLNANNEFEPKSSTNLTTVGSFTEGKWQGYYTQSGSSKNMIFYVENISSPQFAGKVHLPTTSNAMMSMEGKILPQIDDIVEQSKWKYIEEYDENAEQTLLYFNYTGKLQGGSIIMTATFRAVADDSGAVIKGAWFYNDDRSEPEGYFTLFRE